MFPFSGFALLDLWPTLKPQTLYPQLLPPYQNLCSITDMY